MVIVDDDHLGPLLNIAAWILIVVAALLGFAKIITKWRITSELYADDGFMAVSILFAIGSTAAASSQVSYGLGSRTDGLSQDDIDSFQKALMATDILYIVTIFSAKLSLICFLRNFTPPNGRRKAVDVSIYALSFWTAIAVICTACRCKAPVTWDLSQGPSKCIQFNVFWTINSTIDILSQLLVAVSPIILLWDVQISRQKKRLAIVSYLPIVTTIPFEVLRLISIWQTDPFSTDFTFDMYHSSLYTVMHADYSVIASCSTFLIPIVEALSVGLISSKVALIPMKDNPHVRRDAAAAPFNPLVVLGGQNFLVTNVTAGTPNWTMTGSPSTSRNNTRPHSMAYSKRTARDRTSAYYAAGGAGLEAGSRRGSKALTAAEEVDLELEQMERFHSRDPMVINTTTTFEWRSGRNSISTTVTPTTPVERVEEETEVEEETPKSAATFKRLEV